MSASSLCQIAFIVKTWASPSALESPYRKALEHHANLGFALLLISTGIVTVGIFFEWPEVGDGFRNWRKLRSSETSWLARPPSRSRLPLWALVGFILVAGGVALEGVFEAVVGIEDTKIRAFDELAIADTELKTAHVNERAERLEAANASMQIQVKDARQEADSFARDIASTKKKAADAESRLADETARTKRLEAELSWRTVTPEQEKEIKDFLSPFLFNPQLRLSGLKIEFEYNNSDLEGYEYAEELAKALRDQLGGFGAEVGEPRGVVSIGGPPATGLIMSVRRADDRAAILLQLALKAAGINAPGNPNSFGKEPEMTIKFFVGAKPKPPIQK